MAMALEAVQHTLTGARQVSGYLIKEAHFLRPVIIRSSSDQNSGAGTETMLHLRPVRRRNEKESVWSEVAIYALLKEQWTECFRASIQVQYEEPEEHINRGKEGKLAIKYILEQYDRAENSCNKSVDSRAFYKYHAEIGMKYGKSLQLLDHIHWDGKITSLSRVDIDNPSQTGILVHPAFLDGALHSFAVHTSEGLSRPSNPHVPHQISNAWVSPLNWQRTTPSVRVLTVAQRKPVGRSIDGTMQVLADDGSILCSFQSVVLTAVENSENKVDLNKRFLCGIKWRPQLSLLEPQQLDRVCEEVSSHKDETDWERYHLKLDSVLQKVVHSTYLRLSQSEVQDSVPSALVKYVSWMEHRTKDSTESIENLNIDTLEEELAELQRLHPPWSFFPEVARNLYAILTGEKDPLSVAFDTGLAERLYDDLFKAVGGQRLQSLLELFSHENPGMRIIEVGAGTGGWSRCILSALQSFETATGASAFSEYSYTDISMAFFEKASERFSDFQNRMVFKTLDLDRDIAQQGFQPGSYDLVIAGSVLHATKDLSATIRNIRGLLKPGGHLINVEPISPHKVVTNFGFGLLPGWWLCNEEWRAHSPVVNEATWDKLLRSNGFSGTDLIVRDFERPDCHMISMMLSTANKEPIEATGHKILLLLETKSGRQMEAARRLQEELWKQANCETTIACLTQVQPADLSNADVTISLVELGSFLFREIGDAEYQSVKELVKHCQRLLWVSSSHVDDSMHPFHGLMKGLWRTVRSEAFEKHIVTLGIEAQDDSDVHLDVSNITKVYEAAFLRFSPELEFVLRDQYLMSGRLVEEKSSNNAIRQLLAPQITLEPFGADPPVKLTVETPGLLDSICFTEDHEATGELGPFDVEIESKLWALNFRDVFIALGRLEEDDIGSDCAGIVTRVGNSCTSVAVGDRVCIASLGCMRRLCRVPEVAVHKIPDEVSLEAAVSVLTPGITAYYSLITVGRLQKGDKVLIHSASGGTGQMAVEIAKMVGAEIFATVGLPEKRALLIEKGIPAENIFYSRDTSFARGIKRVTCGRGVDVVLNSLSGDALRASFECLAPFGRFVEIGKEDIGANSPLPMGGFARNTTFSAPDLAHMMRTNRALVGELLMNVMNLLARGAINHPNPLQMYSVSDTQRAFRHLQSGKSTGRVILRLDGEDMVPVNSSFQVFPTP
jgi:NADPH:quinone reductase-like Zn-dependent oxidoreductase/SAM-dependent methyltransferase